MSASGLVTLLAQTLASRYPIMRLKTDPPLSPEEHEERARVEDLIHSLPDHLKVTIVEECETHHALWFYSTMFGLDNLADLTEELTGKLWYQAVFPDIPKRVVMYCDTVKYTCIAIGPGLVVAGGGTTIGVLESDCPVSGERGQRQGVFRRFDVKKEENDTRTRIVGISVVEKNAQDEHRRNGHVIALIWSDGHGSAYTFVDKGLHLIKKMHTRDYVSCPMRQVDPVFNSAGRVTYRTPHAVITYPVYRSLEGGAAAATAAFGRSITQVNDYHCGYSTGSVFFSCAAGFAVWYEPESKQVEIMYCPVTLLGVTVYAVQNGPRENVMGTRVAINLSPATARVSSLHITRDGIIFIGFNNGGILGFMPPPVQGTMDEAGWDNRVDWMQRRRQTGLLDEDRVCNLDTGFDGAVEGIYSDETGRRLAVVFSSGFLQVYDLNIVDDSRYVDLTPVRTIDLMVLVNVLDEKQPLPPPSIYREEEDDDGEMERRTKKAKISLETIEATLGSETRYIARHRQFATTKKIVRMDARRIVYYNVDMQILSVWSFGPCI